MSEQGGILDSHKCENQFLDFQYKARYSSNQLSTEQRKVRQSTPSIVNSDPLDGMEWKN